MRPVHRAALLLVALMLPLTVLVSWVLADSARTPQVPAEVRVGTSPGPPPEPVPSSSREPAELPPPPPADDEDDDGPDDDGPDDDGPGGEPDDD